MDKGRFFRRLNDRLQPTNQNKISEFTKVIAEFLQLEDSSKYTGHCFRRTASRCRDCYQSTFKHLVDGRPEQWLKRTSQNLMLKRWKLLQNSHSLLWAAPTSQQKKRKNMCSSHLFKAKCLLTSQAPTFLKPTCLFPNELFNKFLVPISLLGKIKFAPRGNVGFWPCFKLSKPSLSLRLGNQAFLLSLRSCRNANSHPR